MIRLVWLKVNPDSKLKASVVKSCPTFQVVSVEACLVAGRRPVVMQIRFFKPFYL